MKFATALLACLTAAASAQRVLIGSPPDQANLSAGQNTTIQIVLPNFQSSSQEVAVVLGITSCAAAPCPAPADTMGRILYSGHFNPQRHPEMPAMQAYQNFTVFLPENLPKGAAQINVYHVALIGAGLMPWNETLSTTALIQ
ncbi:hypothetical protein Agabi119p4_7627 [Agaricus bisporus var. burnettii]|uniref:Phosphatidylglycerol/phosphatidylinositol transfer protein n=1 Tax=Agaricus bisporus var. burnettii TaxID=192524 RepID=A0A8H7C793_AGABI|nr:hypothetical protein Agabi119p4_7627 [Agaricus bisporus var. burnettii]